jgi:Pyruvate/2-oxoacid:ferredoxin oxidoreductase delta subunit
MKNYSEELFRQKKSDEFMRDFINNFDEETKKGLSKLESSQKGPFFIRRFLKNMIVKKQKKIHYGQIVPLEDIEKIIDLVKSVVRLPCVCRKLTLGKEVRYCFGVGAVNNMLLKDFPDFSNEFEVLKDQEAKKVFREMDEKGLVHSVWTFVTPYIGGICNCDQDCLAYKIKLNYDIPIYFKAEYVGVTDWERCNGCKECKKFCQYGAILFSAFNEKCSIDPQRCYGCGICRAVCPNEAISLIERDEFKVLASAGVGSEKL